MKTNPNKKFKYNFTKLFYVIAAVGAVIAILCIVFNVINFVKLIGNNIAPSLYQYGSLILAVVLSIAYIVLVVAALFKSYYFITDKELVLKWGLIKNTLSLNDAKEIKLTTNTSKLELVFEDESWFNIAINNNLKEEFVQDLKSKHEKIVFVQETTPIEPNNKD